MGKTSDASLLRSLHTTNPRARDVLRLGARARRARARDLARDLRGRVGSGSPPRPPGAASPGAGGGPGRRRFGLGDSPVRRGRLLRGPLRRARRCRAYKGAPRVDVHLVSVREDARTRAPVFTDVRGEGQPGRARRARTGAGSPLWLATHPSAAKKSASAVDALARAGACSWERRRWTSSRGRFRARTRTTARP